MVPVMGTPPHSNIDTVARRTVNTSEMHNASVNEAAAMEGECAQVHLPTGRMCTLPYGHRGSCEFISAEAAARWHIMRPAVAGNRPGQG